MNAVAWSDDKQTAIYGKILHEDLFDGTTLIRDNFGRDKKFKNSHVEKLDKNRQGYRIQELEKALQDICSIASHKLVCR